LLKKLKNKHEEFHTQVNIYIYIYTYNEVSETCKVVYLYATLNGSVYSIYTIHRHKLFVLKSIKIYELQGHQVFNIYIMQFRGWDEDSSIVAQETALKMFSKAVP